MSRATIYNLTSKTLIPGLIEAHANFRRRKTGLLGLSNADQTNNYRDMHNLCVANGVINIRSCGNYRFGSLTLHDKINAGRCTTAAQGLRQALLQ